MICLPKTKGFIWISFLAGIQSCSACFGQYQTLSESGLASEDRLIAGLRGNVQMLSVYYAEDVIEYWAKQKSNPEYGIQTFHEYNQLGRQIREVNFDAKGRLDVEKQTRYSDSVHIVECSLLDNYGNVLRKETFEFSGSLLVVKTIRMFRSGLTGVQRYDYSADGLISRMSYFENDSLVSVDLYRYKAGALLRIEQENFQTDELKSFVYEYSAQGKLATVTESEPESKQPLHISEFNSDGQIIAETWFNSQGMELKSNVIEYNDRGQRTSFTTSQPGQRAHEEKYLYDSAFVLVGMQVSTPDRRMEWFEYLVDEKGRNYGIRKWLGFGKTHLLSEHINEMSPEWTVQKAVIKNYGSEGQLTDWVEKVYFYDEHGNWIRIEEFADGIAAGIKVRRITYFP